MRYTVVCDSDIGKSRMVNQDAVAIKHIRSDDVESVFAILCDGMGGFKEGEIASSSVVKAFLEWFDKSYSVCIRDYDKNIIYSEWNALIEKINGKLYRYGKLNGITIGTTVTVLLLQNDDYYILNVGDSRAYEMTKSIRRITSDHSVVAQEVLDGILTEEEARHDERKNQLLKSIGVLKRVTPDFFTGKVKEDAVYMLCCDGVRNKVYDEELLYYFHPSIMCNKNNMNNNIRYVFSLNESRNETDNMSVVLVKVRTCIDDLTNGVNSIVVYDEKVIINSDRYLDIEVDEKNDYI